MKKNSAQNIAVYGVAHALVDCVSVGVLFSVSGGGMAQGMSSFGLVVLYIILAFGLQAVAGMVVDYTKAPKTAAIFGVILVGLSALAMTTAPIIAVVLAGIGNAIFHVGGGVVSLSLTPRRATAAGLFVAFGAIGLLLGTLLGKMGLFSVAPFVIAALLAVLAIIVTKNSAKTIMYEDGHEDRVYKKFEMILLFVMFAIVIRSYVGMILLFPWKSNLFLLIALTCAVFLGKALGGILADRFGWNRIAVGALIISAPLLAFWSDVPAMAILGVFLFNITMPVTLVVMANILPKHAGLSFGLTCFALFLGTLPVVYGWQIAQLSTTGTLVVILISAVALFIGLKLYDKSAELNVKVQP